MYLKSHLNDCEILVVLITITRANRSGHGSGGPRGGAQGGPPPPSQFHLPENDCEDLKIGIKDGFEEMEHEVSLWNIPSGKTGLPFQMFLCSRKFFRWENPKSLVPFTCTFQPDFPENFCIW